LFGFGKRKFLASAIRTTNRREKSLGLGVRGIERFILGSAFEVEIDNQGRIIIPEILSQYGKFNKELVFVGLIDRVEIWAKENWDKQTSELAKTTKDYIEEIGK